MLPLPTPLLTVAAAGAAPAYKSFDFSGSDSYAELVANVLTATPCTFMCWFNADIANTGELLTVGGLTARAGIHRGQTADTMSVYVNNTTLTQRNGDAPTTFGTGAWHHLVGVLTSDSSRTCYQDGVAGTTNTLSLGFPATPPKVTIGCCYSSNIKRTFFPGKIAHAAIWNIALSGTDISALAAGALPSAVQSGNLVFYADLQGGIAKDSISNTALSTSGITPSTDGPF